MTDTNKRFDRFLKREWRKERAQGHMRFIWLRRGIPLGLSVGALIAGWLAYEVNTKRSDLSNAQVLLLAYAVVVGAVLFAAFEGHIEWTQRERAYRNEQWRPGFQARGVELVRAKLSELGASLEVFERKEPSADPMIEAAVRGVVLQIRDRSATIRRGEIASIFRAEDFESEAALVAALVEAVEFELAKRSVTRTG